MEWYTVLLIKTQDKKFIILEKVAIKKIKINDKENGFPITSLREIKSL